MQKKVIEFNQEQRKSKAFPDFQAGDVIKVHLKIKEGGKERIQVFQGLVIAIKGRQSASPILTVRKVSGGVGVEMIIPIYSKNVEKIELIKRAKVRRAKLYYVRGLTAKQSRMKYRDISDFVAPEDSKEASEKTEEVKTETKESSPEEKPKKEEEAK